MLSFFRNFKHTTLNVNSCLRDVLERLTWGGQSVFFINNEGKLLGSISDGDVRRALISGANLESLAFPFSNKKPIVASEALSAQDIINLMDINLIRAVPVVTDGNCITQIAYKVSKSNNVKDLNNVFFIFAGGRGERMRPHTDRCPKPMLKVAGKPILLHIIEKAKNEGFYKFIIAVNYLSNVISDYLGNGNQYGVEISYLNEKTPLGTAGAMSLIKDPISEPFLVSNGDVLTDLNYRSLLEYHKTSKADACIVLAQQFDTLKYGVVKVSDGKVVSIDEKPTIKRLINAGVYVLNPNALEFLKPGAKKNITTLFSEMIESGRNIVGYQIHENWSDIGYPKDLENANETYGDLNFD